MTGILFGGLISGCLYAMVAIGLVVVYRTSSAINFSQADVGTAGTFMAIAVTQGRLGHLPVVIGAVIGVLSASLLSAGIYVCAIRPIERSRTDVFSTMVATLGISMIIEGILQAIFGFNPYAFDLFPKSAGITLLGVRLPASGIAIVVSAVLALAALAFVLYRTRAGLIMRMGGSSETLTQLSGVRVVVVRTTVWAIAGALGGWAIILYGNYQNASPTLAGGLLISSAVAASWGRFRSIPWTLAGAVITGIVVNLAARYISVSLTETVSLALLVLVFLWLQRSQRFLVSKPHGSALAGTVRAFQRLHPRVGVGEQITLTVLAVGAWLVISGYQQQVLEEIFTYAIALCGLGISIRYNGRLNLSAGGFLAVGGYGSVVLENYMPAPVALVAALLIAAAIGAIVAAVTARMEMIFYVQISLLVTACLPELINWASTWTGGNEGLSVSSYLRYSTLLERPAVTFVVAAVAVLTLVAVSLLGSSRFGVRVLLLSRDIRLGEGLGLRGRRHFVAAESLAAAVVALSGALSAHTSGFISPDQFTVNLSVMLLTAVVLGGGWTVIGTAAGALFFVLIPRFVGSLNHLPPIIFGGLLLMMIMFAPAGIEGWLAALYRGVLRRGPHRDHPPASDPDPQTRKGVPDCAEAHR